MSRVLLIYPYFKPRRDRSVFRFPPLGVSYLAASLRQAGHAVELLDCTFMTREGALAKAASSGAEVVGIYCMVTMIDDCRWFAGQMRQRCRLLVAGGPLPTCDPAPFLEHFDVVVRGEGEHTLLELVEAFEQGGDFSGVAGIFYRGGGSDGQEAGIATAERPFERNLDSLAFPARDLLPNEQYIQYSRRKYGYAITTVMSTRGCPFRCEFCSNVIFGGSYRQRSAGNILDEIEQALATGYDRISFADDVFTFNRARVRQICAEIGRRGLAFRWECLGRVDALDYEAYLEMKQAGCERIYFGIESGNAATLRQMNKRITIDQARMAVEAAHRAGLQVGAFFILFYPGETDMQVLNTLRFAGSLPLDYVGFSLPYPLPGTALYERVRERIRREWQPGENLFTNHEIIYQAEFSETKMWLGLIKGHVQFEIKRRLGRLAPLGLALFEKPSDWLFRQLR